MPQTSRANHDPQFFDDGRRFSTTTKDGRLFLWDAQTKKPIRMVAPAANGELLGIDREVSLIERRDAEGASMPKTQLTSRPRE